jgi:anti-anti-sigma factor
MKEKDGAISQRRRHAFAGDAISVGRALNAETGKRFGREVMKFLAAGGRHCVIDMSLTETVDSPGFGSLMMAIRKVRDVGGASAIVCHNATVCRLFEVSGITRLVPVVKRLEEARAAGSADASEALAS